MADDNQTQANEEPKSAPKTEAPKASVNASLNGLEKGLNDALVKNSPVHLPDAAKEWIVQYGPWVLLVILILTVPGLLTLLRWVGFLGDSYLLSFVGYNTTLLWVAIMIQVVGMVMTAAAIPGLLKRQLSAWRMIFWADLVYLVGGVVSWLGASAYFGSFFVSLVGTVIGFWILFQIRSKYS